MRFENEPLFINGGTSKLHNKQAIGFGFNILREGNPKEDFERVVGEGTFEQIGKGFEITFEQAGELF